MNCFRHNKGCNCKRSGCLKNYCECYEAKIPCTVHCKCQGCKNVDSETGAKIICSPLKLGGVGPCVTSETSHLGAETEKWFKPTSSLKSKLLQANTPLDSNDKGEKIFLTYSSLLQDIIHWTNTSDIAGGSKQPFSCVTQEVVEATCQCLLAQVWRTKH